MDELDLIILVYKAVMWTVTWILGILLLYYSVRYLRKKLRE
jgi:hypothetical protein